MTRIALQVGPGDDGRLMSLADFQSAEGLGNYRYELGRGIVAVTNIPNRRHHLIVNAVRQQLSAFEVANPGVIQSMLGGSDCKVILTDLASERHPDWLVYKTPMPTDAATDEDLWEAWVPDVVIEVVSPDSGDRDYNEKPDEYFRFGIPEYWIIDPDKNEMLAYRRTGGRYVPRVVKPGDAFRSSSLNGFELDLAKIFEAARQAGA